MRAGGEGVCARPGGSQLGAEQICVAAMTNLNCATAFDVDCGCAVDRLVHQIIIKLRPAQSNRVIPGPRKAFRTRPRAQGISRLARHPNHLGGLTHHADDAKRPDKRPLPLRRPAVMPVTQHRHRREGRGDGLAGADMVVCVFHLDLTAGHFLSVKNVLRTKFCLRF
jgi:hypothetical protein